MEEPKNCSICSGCVCTTNQKKINNFGLEIKKLLTRQMSKPLTKEELGELTGIGEEIFYNFSENPEWCQRF